jgi:hypothetical protein
LDLKVAVSKEGKCSPVTWGELELVVEDVDDLDKLERAGNLPPCTFDL